MVIRRTRARGLLLSAAAVLIASIPAAGSDVGVIGKSAVVSVSAASGRQTLKSTQKGPGVHFGPSSAASELRGRFELYYVDDPANRAVLDLPSPWRLNNGVLARFQNSAAPAGPTAVKSAILRLDELAKVTAKGAGGIDLGSAPGAGGVMTVLTVFNDGDGSKHRMCSLYGVGQGSRVVHKVRASGAKLALSGGVPAPCPDCATAGGCPDGDDCDAPSDCQSGVCSAGTCQAPTCADGVANGTETDVDCGGATCPACVPFTVSIDGPAHGIFSLAATSTVSGHTTGVGPAGADLTINGAPVALQPDGTFSTSVPLSQGAIFNPIHARLSRRFDGRTAFDRVVVIAGASIPDGNPSPNGIGMRINDTGLDAVEPVATTLIDIDPSTFVTAGTLVLDDYCYAPLGSVCFGSVDVTISGTPPPTIGPVEIALDSQTGSVDGDITLHDLRVTVNVDSATGIPIHCSLHLTVPTTEIVGDYGLSPLAPQPSKVDVNQVGAVSVATSGVSHQTDCTGLLGDLTEALIGQAIGDVGALFADGMEDFLNDVDAEGNTPIAGAIESSLAGVDIAGPVGSGLGIDLDAPFTGIFEDPIGITFAANVAATVAAPHPGAPAITASYHVNEAFPTFGGTTPVQGLPYGLGLAISTSGFNQLLRSQIENGLLLTTLTDIDFGAGPVELTAGLLAAAFPPFSALPPATPIAIRIAPTLAPVLTGASGPAGELGEVRMSQVHVEFVQSAGLPGETVHLALAVDSRIGLDLAFEPGGIAFVLSTPLASDVTVALLDNPLGVNEAVLQAFLPSVIASFLPDIAGALQTFPLPQFIGLSLAGLEVSRNGQYYSIFADLSPACDAGDQCPSGVCLANVCQAPTCDDRVANGSETALDCGGGSCPGCPVGAACFLGTDCAAGGCSGGICQPTCTSGAECPSGVCSGGYCRVPNCADGVQNGSETDLDCGGPAPTCLRCADGEGCGAASDCSSGVCAGGACQVPTCSDGVRNGSETDVDCGGPGCPDCGLGEDCDVAGDCASGVCGANGVCTCGSHLFTFTVNSSSGGPFDTAEWPGGTATQSASPGCSVTINRPDDSIDLVCTLAAPFSVNGFAGYSQCFGSGGEDGDGCEPVSCPLAGIGSCCSGRPSCSAALNGSGQARYRVQCLE
jgi:hypothetical protein